MEACGAADKQWWYVKRLSEVPRRMVPTHCDTAATRCLEAVRTGSRTTSCSRRQNGHRWHSNNEPTM